MYHKTILDLVRQHPEWPWSIGGVLSNPSINLEFVECLISNDGVFPTHEFFFSLDIEEVDRYVMSQIINWMDQSTHNRSLSYGDFWHICHYTSSNPIMTPDFVSKYANLPWDWYYLSEHLHIISENITRYPIWSWEWSQVSSNTSLTSEFVSRHLNELDWKNLSGNPAMTSEIISQHIDWPWEWTAMSSNESLSLSFVEQHINQDWDWNSLSINSAIDVEFVKRHPDRNWSRSALCQNPNFLPLIETYLDNKHQGVDAHPWKLDLHYLSYNPAVTPELIDRHPHLLWNWMNLSLNKNMTENFVSRHIDKRWDWRELSSVLGRRGVTETFKRELEHTTEEMKYRPGREGYQHAKREFELMVKDITI